MSDVTEVPLQVDAEDGIVLVSGPGIALSLSPAIAADAAHRLEAAAVQAVGQRASPDEMI
jgi:hypothetical protein